MPDINQLFDNLHRAQLHALHADCADERSLQRERVRACAQRVHTFAYPQPGSFMPG